MVARFFRWVFRCPSQRTFFHVFSHTHTQTNSGGVVQRTTLTTFSMGGWKVVSWESIDTDTSAPER